MENRWILWGVSNHWKEGSAGRHQNILGSGHFEFGRFMDLRQEAGGGYNYWDNRPWSWSPWLQQKVVRASCEMLAGGILRTNKLPRSACPGNSIPLGKVPGEGRMPSLPCSTYEFCCFFPKDCFEVHLSELCQLGKALSSLLPAGNGSSPSGSEASPAISCHCLLTSESLALPVMALVPGSKPS